MESGKEGSFAGSTKSAGRLRSIKASRFVSGGRASSRLTPQAGLGAPAAGDITIYFVKVFIL